LNQRIPILYDRELRPEWIDFALEQFVCSTDTAGYHRVLRQYLAPQISSATSLRKTVSQLERCVGHKSVHGRAHLESAYQAMRELSPSQRGTLRLQLLEGSNAFVADCLRAMRMLGAVSAAGVEPRILYERLIAQYGDRGTVPRRVRYVLRTLANLGVVKQETGRWRLAECDASSSCSGPPCTERAIVRSRSGAPMTGAM
jgi:hypothetical protein